MSIPEAQPGSGWWKSCNKQVTKADWAKSRGSSSPQSRPAGGYSSGAGGATDGWEKFPAAGAERGGEQHLAKDGWARTTATGQLMQRTLEEWLKKYGRQSGLVNTNSLSYGVAVESTDPQRTTWKVMAKDGSDGKGISFSGTWMFKWDASTGQWGLKKEQFNCAHTVELMMNKGGSGAGSPGRSGTGASAGNQSPGGQQVDKKKKLFEREYFDGEKFPEARGSSAFASQMMTDNWQQTAAGEAMKKSVDGWIKQNGAQTKYGLSAAWANTYKVSATPVEGTNRQKWNVTIEDGKAGKDPSKPSGVGKLFWGNFTMFLDPDDGRWAVKANTFETKDAGNAPSPKADADAKKKERGFCEAPCVFVPNPFDPRFCKDCQKWQLGK